MKFLTVQRHTGTYFHPAKTQLDKQISAFTFVSALYYIVF